MPRALAEGRTRLDFLAALPADPESVTLTELAAAVALSPAVLASDYNLTPTDSDTVNEKSLVDEGNTVTFAASNYQAAMTFFRYLTTAGASDPGQDVAWETFTGKGVAGYMIERVGPKATTAWAAGNVYNLYEVISDNPQQPQERTGYIKFRQPFGVQGLVVLRGVVVA